MIDEKRLKEIEDRLNAVDEARPGHWISVIGSGHNQCTAISAELAGPRLTDDGKKIIKPEVCPHRDNPDLYTNPDAVQCKKNPMLRWVKLCNKPEEFPDDCPLEISSVDYCFVADCLPEYALKSLSLTNRQSNYERATTKGF